MFRSREGENLIVTRDGPVATLRWRHSSEVAERRAARRIPDVKMETADALLELGADDSVRVVVVTGTGDEFKVAPRGGPSADRHGDPAADWNVVKGITRVLQVFVELDQPIVAKINGAAVGWGSSAAFACDFIFAAEDALLVDHHLAMDEWGSKPYGPAPKDFAG